MLYNFEWDIEKEKQNTKKHNISFDRATTVFRDPNQISIFDDDHSHDEDRWITIGIDGKGVLLIVIHTFITNKNSANIRIISARKAIQTEIEQYEELNQ